MKLTTLTLFSQAKNEIMKMINDNYSFMDKLPSEQQFAEQMGVSRNTVREALKALENEGVLLSRHGVGTFVISTPGHLKHNIAVLNSTTDIIANNGYQPGSRSVHFDKRTAPAEIRKRMNLPEDQEYLYIERVRTADERPIAYVEDYIPYQEGLLELFSTDSETPVFPMLDQMGKKAAFSNCTIHAVLSTLKHQKYLTLPDITSLLLLQQNHYSNKGELILYSESYFLTNELEFSLVRSSLD